MQAGLVPYKECLKKPASADLLALYEWLFAHAQWQKKTALRKQRQPLPLSEKKQKDPVPKPFEKHPKPLGDDPLTVHARLKANRYQPALESVPFEASPM